MVNWTVTQAKEAVFDIMILYGSRQPDGSGVVKIGKGAPTNCDGPGSKWYSDTVAWVRFIFRCSSKPLVVRIVLINCDVTNLETTRIKQRTIITYDAIIFRNAIHYFYDGRFPVSK